jgi:LPS-assembly protein
MKNKIIKLLIMIVIVSSFSSKLFADEFSFNVTEIQIYNDGNLIKGINGGTVTSNNNTVTIEADYFEYDKLKSILKANGNVVATDIIKNTIIKTNELFYIKDEEKLFTNGVTNVNVSNKYFIKTKNLFYFRNTSILSSDNKTTIKDTINNSYLLNKFTYLANEEILKGEKIQVLLDLGSDNIEKHFYEIGFFDLKKNKFLAKDLNIKLDKFTFDNKENDPRFTALSGQGDKLNTFLNKVTFTSCKKSDKCPPWIIEAKNAIHDKTKRQIIYKDAWLKIYDFPVVYFPKFFHPDPTVKRQSGLLKPRLEGSKLLGSAVHLPYFFVISDDKDLTIKPRFYDDRKVVLQGEYRQKTKKTTNIADFSFTKGHSSKRIDDTKDTRTHFFLKSFLDLNFDKFLRSDLEITIQKVSNDSYLKIFNLDSPLLKGDNSVLENEIMIDLEKDDYNFSAKITSYETLGVSNNDRYQYVLPSFNFSKLFNHDKLDGYFNITSSGNNNLKETNKLNSSLTNDINFISSNKFTTIGFKNNFGLFYKNLNTIGKNSDIYKNSLQSEIMSNYIFNTSFPLIKKNNMTTSLLEPKLSLRFSPHQMKNHEKTSSRLSLSNVFTNNRLGLDDSYEEGASLTIGFDYKKEKLNIREQNKIKKIRDYIEFKMATVFRNSVEKNLPSTSSLNQKSSNIFGELNFQLSENINLNYDFSIDNDFTTFEYNSFDAEFNYKNFSTQINYLEERGKIGKSNIISNISTYKFNDYNSLRFSTRRNRMLNLTEYYDLIYEYENDCLTAGIKYRKKFYSDTELKPSEELFFTVTIVPLGTFSPDAITRNN